MEHTAAVSSQVFMYVSRRNLLTRSHHHHPRSAARHTIQKQYHQHGHTVATLLSQYAGFLSISADMHGQSKAAKYQWQRMFVAKFTQVGTSVAYTILHSTTVHAAFG